MTHPQWWCKCYAKCKSALDTIPKNSGTIDSFVVYFPPFATPLRCFSLLIRRPTIPLLLFLQSNYNVIVLYLRSQPRQQANKSSFRDDAENVLWAAGWNAADELVIRVGNFSRVSTVTFLLFVSQTFMSLAEQTWLGCVCSKFPQLQLSSTVWRVSVSQI